MDVGVDMKGCVRAEAETGASGARDAILTGGTTAAAGSTCLVAGETGEEADDASDDETGIEAASAAFEADACATSPCVSGTPKRDAPRGAAGVAAATATGGMSRRCERVKSGAFARVTEAASFGAAGS
jgi:hypothetical protein